MDVAFGAAKMLSKVKPEHIKQGVKLAQQIAKAVDPKSAEALGAVSDLADLHGQHVAMTHGMADMAFEHNVAHAALIHHQHAAMVGAVGVPLAVGGVMTLEQQQLAYQHQLAMQQQQQQQLAYQQQQQQLAYQQQLAMQQQQLAAPTVVQVGVPSVQIGMPNMQVNMPSVQVGMSNVQIGMPNVQIGMNATLNTPPPPPPAPKEETAIWANFPDGCVLGFHFKVGELEIKGKVPANNGRRRLVPARPASSAPSPPLPEEAPPAPVPVGPVTTAPTVEKRGMMTKLGGSQTVLGTDSWQHRFFALNAKRLSYAKDERGGIIDSIELHGGIEIRVIDAYTSARRNRFKNMDVKTLGDVALQGMGKLSDTSGPIGKDYCIEMIVPGKSASVASAIASTGINPVAAAFDMKLQAQGRTYYMACTSQKEADEWADALSTNINALKVAPAPPKPPKRDPMEDAQDPLRSLEWYKRTLGLQLPNELAYTVLCKFYDDLDKVGVFHG